MIDRYSLPEMAAIFADTARFDRYLQIELHATDAHATLGIVPATDAIACRQRAPIVDDSFVAAVNEREAITNHDVAAFVDVTQAAIGMPAGAWIHYGLTSSDVVDTAWCWMLRDACDLLITAADELFATVVALAREHRDTVMIGRTHGMHAEPTTFGAKVALWALQIDRDRTRLHRARDSVAVCKLSGAVGVFGTVEPAVEQHVAAALGLRAVPATQVVARDRHADFLYACAAVGDTMESIAVELRHLQRTEVGEVQEGFSAGQKGSSAMPHKRNPIAAETITGLARVLRSNLQAGLQNVALWHERDISHSSVERIVLPDSALLAFYVLRRMNRLLADLQVFPQRMFANLDASHGTVFSQPILLALIRAGIARDDAYRIVQEAAAATDGGPHFRQAVEAAPAVRALAPDELAAAFDLQHAIRHAGRAVDALDF